MTESKTLKTVGEDAAIAALQSIAGKARDAVIGSGDDCAVVPVEGGTHDWLLTSDPVVEGIHFDADTDPRLVGRKAVGRVFSDIAAMGGEPVWLLINVTAPESCTLEWLRTVYRGARSLCRKYGAQIIGGDTGKGPIRALHVFGVGRVPRGDALRRSGARPGDAIYVTGRLGGSRAGGHLKFEPRIEQGLWLREQGWPSALMDVSDGVATDLRRLLTINRVGAELDVEAIPVSPAVRRLNDDGQAPWMHALTDGEDFELLFTVSPARCALFESSWKDTFRLRCTRIGAITATRNVLKLREADGEVRTWEAHGFEHFRR